MRADWVLGRWCALAVCVGLCVGAACRSEAATVTYTLSIHDDGTDNPSPTSPSGQTFFAIYAEVSADNGGLFTFAVDLTRNNDFNGRADLDAIYNMAPMGQFRKTGAPTKYIGFGVDASEDPIVGLITGVTDVVKGSNLIPVYGFGQSGGDLSSYRPTGYGPYFDVSPNAAGPLYSAKMLLGIGAYTGCSAPALQISSVNNKASVYVSRSGVENTPAGIVFRTLDPQVVSDSAWLSSGFASSCASGIGNRAVGGFIALSGANGSYSSEVDPLLDPPLNVGGAPIMSIGNEAGNVYVMARLSGTAQDIAAVLATLDSDVNATDPQWGSLHAIYDPMFGGSGFNALFKFPNLLGDKIFNWDFSAHPGVTVAALAVVPEPGMIGLLIVASICLSRRGRGQSAAMLL